jgi:sugar/nucleoside kinase (ribokinase family)
MTRQAMDTVGAGDAFFGAAALLGRVGAEPELSSVLANLSGALAVGWPGNKEVADGPTVVKNARYLLASATRGPRP